jgi:hypothetical protein
MYQHLTMSLADKGSPWWWRRHDEYEEGERD